MEIPGTRPIWAMLVRPLALGCIFAAGVWLLFSTLSGPTYYHPHACCYLFESDLIWTHVISDLIIGLSYISISGTLVYLVIKTQVPFHLAFIAFGVFIAACGATHFMEVLTVWKPHYWLAAAVKIVTAAASFTTAIWLYQLFPKARAMIDAAALAEEQRKSLRVIQTLATTPQSSPTAEVLGDKVATLQLELAASAKQVESLVRSLASRHREAEEALRVAERSNKVKDEFLMVLSHELRTPLTPILGWSKMMLTQKFSDQDRIRGLQVIERNAQAECKLIEELLDTSRIIAGKLSIEPKPVDLHAIIDASIESMSVSAKTKYIVLEKKLAEGVSAAEPCMVNADHGRLQQVLRNILSNAIKFAPENGHVQITLTKGACAQIAIQDNGPGISPEFLPHIFNRFEQQDTSTTRLSGGLGLGLAIARSIVEMHGGSIIAANGESGGAIFTVSIPLAGDISKNESAPICKQPELTNLSAIVVEDDIDTRYMVLFLLKNAGMRAASFPNTAEAFIALQESTPDVLISDIGMPEEDGLAFIRKVRSLPVEKGGQVKAIALTAFASDDERAAAIQAGYQIHVPKPIDPQTLLAAVSRLVNGHVKA